MLPVFRYSEIPLYYYSFRLISGHFVAISHCVCTSSVYTCIHTYAQYTHLAPRQLWMSSVSVAQEPHPMSAPQSSVVSNYDNEEQPGRELDVEVCTCAGNTAYTYSTTSI